MALLCCLLRSIKPFFPALLSHCPPFSFFSLKTLLGHFYVPILYCDVKSRPFKHTLDLVGCCAFLLHSSYFIPEEKKNVFQSELGIGLQNDSQSFSEMMSLGSRLVSSVLGCSRHSWLSSQMSLSRMCSERGGKLKEPWIHLHTHTQTEQSDQEVIQWPQEYISTQYQLRTVSKSVTRVIQKTVPDGVATAALSDGRLIWVAVWMRSTSSLAQISSAQSSLSGSHLEAFQHVWVAPIYLWHHSTALDESRGEMHHYNKFFLPRGWYLSFFLQIERKKRNIIDIIRIHIYLFSKRIILNIIAWERWFVLFSWQKSNALSQLESW